MTNRPPGCQGRSYRKPRGIYLKPKTGVCYKGSNSQQHKWCNGKMISLLSGAVATAVTDWPPGDEAKLFPGTPRPSVKSACVIGLAVWVRGDAAPGLQP